MRPCNNCGDPIENRLLYCENCKGVAPKTPHDEARQLRDTTPTRAQRAVWVDCGDRDTHRNNCMSGHCSSWLSIDARSSGRCRLCYRGFRRHGRWFRMDDAGDVLPVWAALRHAHSKKARDNNAMHAKPGLHVLFNFQITRPRLGDR